MKSERELAAEVVSVLRAIEGDMWYVGAKGHQVQGNYKPASYRMDVETRERLVELRLRMERIEIAG